MHDEILLTMGTLRTIIPIASVEGSMRVPGSKSIANRALVCAALAQGQSVIRNMSDSTDTAMMLNGLDQMGVLATATGTEVHVTGTGGVLYAPKLPSPSAMQERHCAS